jgi:hypothetical protein
MKIRRDAYIDIIHAKGHSNVRATHRTTFEVTREDHLTPRGDCIIAVSADKSLRDLDPGLRMGIKRGWPVVVIVSTGDLWDYSIGWGDPRLELSGSTRIVVRRSTYISPNTLMIRASKAAADLDRRLVDRLRRGDDVYILISTSPDLDKLLRLILFYDSRDPFIFFHY